VKIVWTSRSQRDRADIFDFIADDNPQAALELDEDFMAAAARLSDFPKLASEGIVPNTREWLVRRNYRLVYRISGDELVIVAVVHARQDWPGV
jgi:toxin ParE1/3/4